MKIIKKSFSVFLILLILVTSILSVSALDNLYHFEELGFAVKLDKHYPAITRETKKDDSVFSKLGLNYTDTITAMKAADIYLLAYGNNKAFEITVSGKITEDSKKINNYSDLTEGQRNEVLNTFKKDKKYSNVVSKKCNDYICYEFEFLKTDEKVKIYGKTIETIVNGIEVELSIQKENVNLTVDEEKILINLANSLSFDVVYRNSGPVFDWWRVILWVLVLVLIAVLASFIFKKRKKINEAKKQRRSTHTTPRIEPLIPERPDLAEKAIEETIADLDVEEDEQGEESFEETLGYRETEEFNVRADTDLDTFDINVKEKNSNKGIEYFEDNGESIKNYDDYFDKYFKEKTEHRTVQERFFSSIGTYIQIVFRHLGYFFINLWKSITGFFKN